MPRRCRGQPRAARRGQDRTPGGADEAVGMDVGSTTVKAVVVERRRVTWQDYQRHNTRQAEKVFEFLERMEREGGIDRRARSHLLHRIGRGVPGAARRRQAGPGGRRGRGVRGEAAPRRALRLRDRRRGHEDDLLHADRHRPGSKQVFMQSACSGGTGTFIEKTARKLQVPSERLAEMPYAARASTRSAASAGSSPRPTPTPW